MPGDSLIEVQGIAKTFRSGILCRPKVALAGLDFEVGAGEILGFLGPNGAGKTTTIKILLGLVRPTRGDGTVLGQPFGSMEARAGLGFLPDLPYFYSYLSGRELLRLTGRLHSIPKSELERRIVSTLERVRLDSDSWDRRLRHYSRGMLQRIGIAAAIVHRPRLLVLDEPMTGLDPIGRRELRDLLLEMKAEGVTIFFSSHLLADVESIADRVALLAGGRIVRCAPLDEVLTSNRGTVEISFELPGGVMLSDLDLTERIELGQPSGRTMNGTAPDFETANLIASRILDCGGRLIAFTPHRESLEDVFVREIAKASSPGASASASHPSSPTRAAMPAGDATPARRRALEEASR